MPLKDRFPDQAPIYLIDGSTAVFRAFYAFPDLKRSDGFPTNALFIVLRILLKILREERPRYLAFFLDGPGPTFREDIYEPYKMHREATPEPLVAQIPPIKKALELLGVPVVVSQGVEADDLMASLARRFRDDHPVVLVAADKDLKQCLDANVLIWDPASKVEKVLTLDEFQADTGLSPAQWPDFQALTGDSTDNIPGVPGVGPKTAMNILQKLPNLEALAAGLDQLTPGERKKVEPHVAETFTWRELTRLKTDLLPEAKIEDYARRPAKARELSSFLLEYEFRSLANELPKVLEELEGVRPPLLAMAEAGQAKTVKQAAGPVDLPNLAGASLGLVDSGGAIHLGYEKDGRKEEWRYTGALSRLAEHLRQARDIACPDLKALFARCPEMESAPLALWFDLGLAAYLLNPEERDYSLAYLLRRSGIPAAEENPGLAVLQLGKDLRGQLAANNLDSLMARLETPLIPVLADMERAGVTIDQKAFDLFLHEVQKELDRLTREVYEHAGGPFNIRSSQQLCELLFGQLKLKTGSKTPKGQPSTSQEALQKLSGTHPVIESILEFRKLEKLRSTYLEPLPRLADSQGRIHTTFNQLATATGRLSSSNPNLQNIPIRGELGRRMRACFTAAPGMRLVAADYSQIELRILAHFSQDPTLLAAFRKNEDIHRRTAALLFDVESGAVTPDQRGKAKTINFGLIYGMGPQRLCQELRIPLREAKEFIERYFSRLAQLKNFYESIEDTAREPGFVTTLAGRRRFLPDIHSSNNQLQSQARRQAINTLIQGSAADVIKMAMLAVHADEELRRLEARLLLQVHDELVFEAPEAAAQEAGRRAEALMCGVVSLDAPLLVEWGAGHNWAQAH